MAFRMSRNETVAWTFCFFFMYEPICCCIYVANVNVVQEWSHAERLIALDTLVESCSPTQVRHIMQVIEPQFQRDFISFLPKEVFVHVKGITSFPQFFHQSCSSHEYRYRSYPCCSGGFVVYLHGHHNGQLLLSKLVSAGCLGFTAIPVSNFIV
jgi:hypothetical protein